jgi:hypothetical protein
MCPLYLSLYFSPVTRVELPLNAVCPLNIVSVSETEFCSDLNWRQCRGSTWVESVIFELDMQIFGQLHVAHFVQGCNCIDWSLIKVFNVV